MKNQLCPKCKVLTLEAELNAEIKDRIFNIEYSAYCSCGFRFSYKDERVIFSGGNIHEESDDVLGYGI